MKKLIAMLLALVLVLGLCACGAGAEKTPETTQPTQAATEPSEVPEDTEPVETAAPVVPNEATDNLSVIWDAYAGEEFFTMGGDMNSMVESAPGNYDLADEGLTTMLYVPEDQIPNLICASSLMHGMLANNFTCGMYLVSEDADVKAFADAMKASIDGTQWLCGMPEKVLIAVVDTQFVMVAFGLNDTITALETATTTVHPGAEILYSEAITG